MTTWTFRGCVANASCYHVCLSVCPLTYLVKLTEFLCVFTVAVEVPSTELRNAKETKWTK